MADRFPDRDDARRDAPHETRGNARAWTVGVVAFLAVGALLFGGPRLFLKPSEQATTGEKAYHMPAQTKLYDPAKPVAQVIWRRSVFVPQNDKIAALDKKQVALVGQTAEGYPMYELNKVGGQVSTGEKGVPGGGGGGQPEDVPQAEGPVYLMTTDGRYVPLVRKGFAPADQIHTLQGGPDADKRPGGR